ncbi:MAG: endolytic transglycosylase MltG [Chloroflexota bacterium]|nr:endolytic transglycosylase MltG [Chloroflexota bacterium]
MTASRWRLMVATLVLVLAFLAAATATVAVSRAPSEPHVTDRDTEAAQPTYGPSSVSIALGDSAASIGRRLEAAGAIGSHTRFELLASLLGWESRLEPGEYTFEAGLTTFEILRRIQSGETSPLRVVIPEGLRLEQVTERLAQSNVVNAGAFRAALATVSDAVVAGSLASNRPPGASLEGYLFPSAYSFPLDGSEEDVIRLMLSRFDESLSQQLVARIEASGRSLHEVLTIASIIEREVIEDSERALVSAVIWNRLDAGMLLQMDSTVQYAVGTEGDWWKRHLTAADLGVESPYNTYRSAGLPPTPIASPGLASIEAAASPANVPYLFFFAKGDGTHAFAVTFEEHQANVERFRGASR